jgi:hypothetical protein
MPSEKAKENKTLAVECGACGKSVSTELARSVIVRKQGRHVAFTVCDECRAKGWQPPTEIEAQA